MRSAASNPRRRSSLNCARAGNSRTCVDPHERRTREARLPGPSEASSWFNSRTRRTSATAPAPIERSNIRHLRRIAAAPLSRKTATARTDRWRRRARSAPWRTRSSSAGRRSTRATYPAGGLLVAARTATAAWQSINRASSSSRSCPSVSPRKELLAPVVSQASFASVAALATNFTEAKKSSSST